MKKIYESGLNLTPAERRAISVLIVESNSQERALLKQILRNLSFETIYEAPSHLVAKEKLLERKVTHVIFECKKLGMPVEQFVAELLELDPKLTLIATSVNPKLDDVFELLTKGTRGYLVKPFTPDGVEQALIIATKAEPFPEAVLKARDRNEALAVLVITALDRLGTILRQTEEFETAKKEVPKAVFMLERAVDMAVTFSRGEEQGYLNSLIEQCIARQNVPSSRLGRLRKRIKIDRDCYDTA
ncbi:MAG: response regulator [Deltaproteobacteria bacterium]|nr:response regulator [Deltaproteobacteria bacterium]MCX7952464.1 response regulator [Deltaproteobacteria bacterium]